MVKGQARCSSSIVRNAVRCSGSPYASMSASSTSSSKRAFGSRRGATRFRVWVAWRGVARHDDSRIERRTYTATKWSAELLGPPLRGQLRDQRRWMGGDAQQDIFQIVERGHASERAALHERIEEGGAPRLQTPSEEPVLPSSRVDTPLVLRTFLSMARVTISTNPV